MKSTTTHAFRAAALLAAVGVLRAETAVVRTGFDYSSGDYGLPVTTQIVTIPFGVSYTSGRTTWDVNLPYLRVDGPGEVVPGIGRFLLRRLLQSKKVVEGVGDLTLGVTQEFAPSAESRWSWAAGAEVKLGTASAAKSLGTGKDDFSAHVDLSCDVGRLAPFVTLGYRWLGNPPGSDLRNHAFGTVGVTWGASERTAVSLLGDWAARTSAGGRAATNLTLAVNRAIGDSWQVQAYGVLGGSDATADHGMGLSLSRTF